MNLPNRLKVRVPGQTPPVPFIVFGSNVIELPVFGALPGNASNISMFPLTRQLPKSGIRSRNASPLMVNWISVIELPGAVGMGFALPTVSGHGLAVEARTVPAIWPAQPEMAPPVIEPSDAPTAPGMVVERLPVSVKLLHAIDASEFAVRVKAPFDVTLIAPPGLTSNAEALAAQVLNARTAPIESRSNLQCLRIMNFPVPNDACRVSRFGTLS